MVKKVYIEMPLEFEGVAIILDESSYPAVDEYIKRGQMPICINLNSIQNPENYTGITIYPNKFAGTLAFVRKGNQISVSAHGTYKIEYTGQDDIELPAKLMLDSVFDKEVTSHYFNAQEEAVDSGVIIELPSAKK